MEVIYHHRPHHEDFKPQLLRAWDPRGSSRTSLFGRRSQNSLFVNLLNLDRNCCLEAAWIIEDIGLIRDSFSFISFHSIYLRCNRAALALANATKENEEVIV